MNGKSNILFDYRPTRNGDHAARFLGDYNGYYAYNKLKKAVRCGCWAHVRRKFVDALPNDKELLPTSAAAKRVENAIRPMCVGRRNWLFSTSVKGAEASAMMYSVAATACANGMKVEDYLTELFRSSPGTLLMPW